MKTTLPLISIVAFALSLMNLPVHADKPAFVADTIILNATVHTMDPAQPVAEAVAIYANRIVAVGTSKTFGNSPVQRHASSTPGSDYYYLALTTRIHIS